MVIRFVPVQIEPERLAHVCAQLRRRSRAVMSRVLAAVLVRLVNGLSALLPDDPISLRIRIAAYRLLRCRIGRRSSLMGGGYINGYGVVIGKGAFVNRNVFFDLNSPVSIGDRVHVGNHVRFITTGHRIGDRSQRAGPIVSAAISIGDGAWIGANAVILPGVRVGAGSIVAAGAVVTRDVPDDTLVGGVPARAMRRLPDGGEPPE